MEGYASVEAIVELFLAELSQFGHVRVAVEGMVRIEAVSVLRTVVVALQDRIRMPSLPVQVCVISGVSAALSVGLLGLDPLIRLSVGGIEEGSGGLERLVRGGLPISLNIEMLTFQPGCALWISVLPYLLLEATFDVSMRTSLFRLKPVEARPKLFLPNLSF